MRKTLIFSLMFLMLSIILTPLCTNAEVNCTTEKILELRKQVVNVKYDIDYDKKFIGEDTDAGRIPGIFKLSFTSIPEGFTVYVISDNYVGSFDSTTTSDTGFSGGIYTIDFEHESCSNTPIRSEKLYIPTYDDIEKKWIDETIARPNTNNTNSLTTIVLFLVLIIIVAILVILIINIYKRRHSNEKNI